MAQRKESDYRAKRARLVEEIKASQFRPAYLFYGEEAYLIKQNTGLLTDALGVPEGDMNFSRFVGKETSADTVIETAMTLPFFAPRRVILVEDSGWLAARKRKSADETSDEDEGAGTGSEDGKKIAAYLKEPCSTTHLIFAESSVTATTTLFRALDKYGFTMSCDPPTPDQLRQWIAQTLKKENLQVERAAVERLLMLVAGGQASDQRIDMNMLKHEMEKLSCYCMGRDTVSLRDVDAVCSDSLTDSVFAMVDKIAKRDRKGAVSLYQDMLALKLAPPAILSQIVRRFNNILTVKELLAEHYGYKEIEEKTGIRYFVVKLCAEWERAYTRERLLEILHICMQGETDFKRGRMSDVAAVETVIVACSGDDAASG